jgi:GNAT superfamily N-acetyltransferase
MTRSTAEAMLSLSEAPTPRDALARDVDQLLPLCGMLFNETPEAVASWRGAARAGPARLYSIERSHVFVVEVEGSIVACAVGTLELNVPNPQCPRGRAVRLANVITLPVHRGRGFGTALVDFVLDWARSIQADRVGLSATPEGSAYTRVRASC